MTTVKSGSQRFPPESVRVPIVSSRKTSSISDDYVTVEEPLEVQICTQGKTPAEYASLAITMRTPGHDWDLVRGFLFAEGIVRTSDDVASLNYTDEPSLDKNLQNVVQVKLSPSVQFDSEMLLRNLITSSSCGICSKSSIAALESILPPKSRDEFSISAEALKNLPRRLRSAQAEFDKTGGLHACATFDSQGNIDCVTEDVGRHNAMDKLVGSYFNKNVLELSTKGALLSGRASFELIHKAAMANVPLVASIGPPSSLAVELASERDITLVGFLKADAFNIYHGADRIHD